jgi:hypothetical protein
MGHWWHKFQISLRSFGRLSTSVVICNAFLTTLTATQVLALPEVPEVPQEECAPERIDDAVEAFSQIGIVPSVVSCELDPEGDGMMMAGQTFARLGIGSTAKGCWKAICNALRCSKKIPEPPNKPPELPPNAVWDSCEGAWKVGCSEAKMFCLTEANASGRTITASNFEECRDNLQKVTQCLQDLVGKKAGGCGFVIRSGLPVPIDIYMAEYMAAITGCQGCLINPSVGPGRYLP